MYDALEPGYEGDLIRNLLFKRNAMNVLFHGVVANQGKYMNHPLLSSSTPFSMFVFRHLNIYCDNDEKITEEMRRNSEFNQKTTEEEVKKRIESEHRIRAYSAFCEVYGRTIVELIDDTISETPGISEKLKAYLIKRKQEILFTFPEVESWYLGIDFFKSKENLASVDNYDKSIRKVLRFSEEEYLEYSRDFWQYSAALAAGELISASCRIDGEYDTCLQNYCKIKYIAACKFTGPEFYNYAQGMVTDKNIRPDIVSDIKEKILLFSKKEEN